MKKATLIERIESLEKDLKRWFKLETCAMEKDKWFIRDQIGSLNDDLNKLYRHLAFLKSKNTESRYDIETIRQIPISKIVKNPVRESFNRCTYKCPLHNEKTASFTWYKDTNSFYCYGCKQGGSVIDLIMKLDGVDCSEALKKLSFYI